MNSPVATSAQTATPCRPEGRNRRRWRPAPISVAAAVALAAGVVVGAWLISDRASCDDVRDRAAPISARLHEPSIDQVESVGLLAQVADRHPSCFTDHHRQALGDLVEHGPPELGILARPRMDQDDAHGILAPTELVLGEARLARRTEHGSFYVIPQRLAGLPRDVCLYLDMPDGSSSLSCSPPVLASARGHQPYPVVLTLAHGVDGLAGIVGDGVSQVLVDGIPTPVRDNVFVAESVSANAEVHVRS